MEVISNEQIIVDMFDKIWNVIKGDIINGKLVVNFMFSVTNVHGRIPEITNNLNSRMTGMLVSET